MNKRITRSLAKMLCATTGICAVVAPLTACGGDDSVKISNESTPLILATDKLDTVFNPFFYTAGADGEIVGQTQIGMLSSDKNGQLIANWNEPCVSHDFSVVTTGTQADIIGNNDYRNYYTDYYFAIKDDIKFSNGSLLTKDDVLFNIYMYLDPAYTGSSTMYSVKIRGLQQYRNQTTDESSGNNPDTEFANMASGRINAIKRWAESKTSTWAGIDAYDYYFDKSTMSIDPEKRSFRSDVDKINEYFRRALYEFWNSCESTDFDVVELTKYKDKSGNKLITKPWQVFLMNFGQYTPIGKGSDPRNPEYYEIQNNYGGKKYDTESLVNYIYGFYLGEEQKATESYKANLKLVLNNYVDSDIRAYLVADAKFRAIAGNMLVKNVSGIKIIRDNKIPTGKDSSGRYTYRALKDKSNGQKEYDILHIRIDGVDPKAIQNFGFTVAPGYYYSQNDLWDAAVADTDDDEHFGVKFSNPSFMDEVRQKQLPVGAGPYKASRRSGGVATQKGGEFYNNGIVYFERNEHFMLGAPKIKSLRFKEITSNQLYNSIKTGEVYYGSPNMKNTELRLLQGSDSSVLTFKDADNLGYGYIGISARYIPNIYIRKAIMTALNPQLCVDYYGDDNASIITRPMSKTLVNYYDNWSAYSQYVYDDSGNKAKALLEQGGCTQSGDAWYYNGKKLKYTFTIAGESEDHPARDMLIKAANVLNKIGVVITVTQDSQALAKLSSGLLTVWAAAWGSSSDPDMYQVYHKDSKATSIKAWGFDAIMSSSFAGTSDNIYNQKEMVEDLSARIDAGRRTIITDERKAIYGGNGAAGKYGNNALDVLMNLAVEFPTYQRKTYYVWKRGYFDESTFQQVVTPYQSPLSKIWEVSFKEN